MTVSSDLVTISLHVHSSTSNSTDLVIFCKLMSKFIYIFNTYTYIFIVNYQKIILLVLGKNNYLFIYKYIKVSQQSGYKLFSFNC